MVSYALLCVFSRFALILVLESTTSMWERRLDLKAYVFLLTFPWRPQGSKKIVGPTRPVGQVV